MKQKRILWMALAVCLVFLSGCTWIGWEYGVKNMPDQMANLGAEDYQYQECFSQLEQGVTVATEKMFVINADGLHVGIDVIPSIQERSVELRLYEMSNLAFADAERRKLVEKAAVVFSPGSEGSGASFTGLDQNSLYYLELTNTSDGGTVALELQLSVDEGPMGDRQT